MQAERLADLFLRGGWVMYPILALSILALGVALERMLFFILRRRDMSDRLNAAREAIIRGDWTELEKIGQSAREPVSRLLVEMRNRAGAGNKGIEEALQYHVSRVITEHERHLGLLGMVAALSPLLGLLGTVCGMIQAFVQVEQVRGVVDAASLAGGIWEALLTTAFGLSVAIPAHFVLHLFDIAMQHRADALQAFAVSAVHIISGGADDSR